MEMATGNRIAYYKLPSLNNINFVHRLDYRILVSFKVETTVWMA